MWFVGAELKVTSVADMVDNPTKNRKVRKLASILEWSFLKQEEQLNLGSAVSEAVDGIHKRKQGYYRVQYADDV